MNRASSFRKTFRPRRLAAAVAACFAAGAALALPTGAQVAAGSAAIAQTGTAMTITNSNGAIINWQSFSTAGGESVRFIQPDAASAVLNRVVGGTASELYGLLNSNGRVFLINPAGILIGKGAQIDVGGFVASTLQISDADFLAGRFLFRDTPGAAGVRNEGTIRSAQGGSVYLVGTQVSNAGSIETPGGETLLAAGRTVEIGDTATPGVRIEIAANGDEAITNLGSVVADAGRIGLVGALIRNSGTLSASSAVAEGGRIFLRGTARVEQTALARTEANGSAGGKIAIEAGDTALVDGRVAATGVSGSGGSVRMLGDKVGLVGEATVDVSGGAGGGTILVGGDFQGRNADVRNAGVTYVGADTTLQANARETGNGGKVIVWADDTTRAYGAISARGGMRGGNGGLVETSGHRTLDFHGRVDTRAPNGQAGTLLLDPTDITITTSGGIDGGSFSGGIFSGGGGATSTIGWNEIATQLNSGNVIISTQSAGSGTGNIAINGAPSLGLTTGSAWISHAWSSSVVSVADYSHVAYNSANNLSFLAGKDITVNASFANAGSGAINVVAGWNGASTTTPVVNSGNGSIVISSGATIASALGDVALKAGNAVAIIGALQVRNGIDLGSGALTISASNLLLQGGTGGYGNTAFIYGNGNQTFNIAGGGLSLFGGGTGTGDYNNAASIRSFGSGSQTFNLSGAGSVNVRGGNGSGAINYVDSSGCPTTGSDFCSNNYAEIRSGSGAQTFNFTNAGSPMMIMGGSSTAHRGNNFAAIGTDGGTQTINGNPMIVVTTTSLHSNTDGGFVYNGKNFGNDAALSADNSGTQTINASSLLVNAALYGAPSGGVANAIVSGRHQTLNVGGAVQLTGGSSAIAGAEYGMAAAAIIGNENSADISLTSGGSLVMTPGTGSSGGAFIGAANGSATIAINASDITMTDTASSARGMIGTLDHTSSNVSLATSGANGIRLGYRSLIDTGANGVLSLKAAGDITMNGSMVWGGSRATFSLLGADSIINLGRYGSGGLVSTVAVNNSAGLITVDYLARSDGGCLLDGLSTFATTAGSSGFYSSGGFYAGASFLNVPAVLGSTLALSYGGVDVTQASTATTTAALSEQLVASTTRTITSSTSGTAGMTAAIGGSTQTPGGTTTTGGSAGSSDEFGGGSATASGGAVSNGTTRTQQTRSMCR